MINSLNKTDDKTTNKQKTLSKTDDFIKNDKYSW